MLQAPGLEHATAHISRAWVPASLPAWDLGAIKAYLRLGGVVGASVWHPKHV